ncbi:MAG: acyl-CoA desaturase [Deltaproteobacteria bacterium]|nr:acyl-CoA desaturase [Deltaproteobacteria bacterium]
MHVVALVGPLGVGVTAADLILCLGMYYLRMFGVTAGYHRYFAHRAFKTSRVFQFVLAFLAQTSAQKGVLWWAGHHRNHHKYADTDRDPHSPTRQGLFWAHIGWILDSRNDATPKGRISDFEEFPELRWLDHHHLVPPTVLAVVLFAFGGLPALVWGFFVSTLFLFHGTFAINSLSHIFGSRRYATKDTSKNSVLLALLTMGEGWHNNHHHYCSSANQGFFWWEFDPCHLILRMLSVTGVVWDLRRPPQRVLDEGRRKTAPVTGAMDHQRIPAEQSALPVGARFRRRAWPHPS